MLTLTIREKNGEERQLSFDKEEVTIGRASGSDIVLPRSNISKRHARLVDKHDKVVIVDLRSTNGTYVNGRRITAPELLTMEDKVYIGDFVIRLLRAQDLMRSTQPFGPEPKQVAASAAPGEEIGPRLSHAPTVAVGKAPGVPGGSGGSGFEPAPGDDEDEATRAFPAFEVPEDVLPAAPPGPPPADEPSDPYPDADSTRALSLAEIVAIAEVPPEPPPVEPPVPAPSAAPAPRGAAASEPAPEAAAPAAREAADLEGELDAWTEWNATVAVMLEAIDAQGGAGLDWEGAQSVAQEVLHDAIAAGTISPEVEREALIQDVVSELVGLGPLGDLLADEEVDRIVIDGPDVIRVWRAGVIEPYGRVFASVRSLEGVAARLAYEGGLESNGQGAIVEVALPAGAAAKILRGPVAVGGPYILVQRARPFAATLAELLAEGALTDAMRRAIEAGIADGKTVVVAGPAGSGRTTMLSTLVGLIGADERLAIIADGLEIAPPQADVVRLNRAAVSEDIFARAARLGATRVVVDEIDSGNALSVMSLLLSGGLPALAAAREPSPERLLERLALQLSLSARADLGDRARAIVGECVDLVISLEPRRSGGPRVAHVVEVQGTRDGFELKVVAGRG